jgi:hypothetical protein
LDLPCYVCFGEEGLERMHGLVFSQPRTARPKIWEMRLDQIEIRLDKIDAK